MATPSIQPGVLSRTSQSKLRKLRVSLKEANLLQVLDSLPPWTDIAMRKTTIKGKNAIELSLGARPQWKGELVDVFGFVLTEEFDVRLPVVFRYELPASETKTGRKQLVQRSAPSMIRKAGHFVLPFRFLQFDPTPEDGRNSGNMLYALVWYYILSAGLSDYALHWPRFKSSLQWALEHIDDNYEYQEWARKQRTASVIAPTAATLDEATSSTTPVASSTEIATRDPRSSLVFNFKSSRLVANIIPQIIGAGGWVVSEGSLIRTNAGTIFAQCVEALGKDSLQLLDTIPRHPVQIERQTTYSNCMPIRLRLGWDSPMNGSSRAPVQVYVYHHMTNGSFTTGEEKNGNTLNWTYKNLHDVKLYQPFASSSQPEEPLMLAKPDH
ncbi:hypothetical protein J1614_005323 [Plenodomus biglobosus]|nr:hypothetical protein J1614_005323 [Plenodomus biglobosus]